MKKVRVYLYLEKKVLREGRVLAAKKDYRFFSHYIEELIKKDF